MNKLPFRAELNNETNHPDDLLRAELDDRIGSLREGHDDIVDAAVAIEELTSSETPYVYQARVVLYMRPNNVAAVEKAPKAMAALNMALDSIERQVCKAVFRWTVFGPAQGARRQRLMPGNHTEFL